MSKLARTLTLIATLLAAVAAVVILSRVLLTLDDIESTDLRIAYGIGLALILAVAGAVAHRLLRRPRPPRPAKPAPARAAPEDRLDRLFARHRLEPDRRDARLRLARLATGEAARIALVGVGRTGKTSLADALAHLLPAAPGLPPCAIVEVPALGNDFATNLERLAPAFTAHLVLFVADQDLRDYEFQALNALIERGQAPIVVVNKADQRGADARAETHASLRRRLADRVADDDIVDAAADPLPLVRVAERSGGGSSEEEVARPADVTQVIARITHHLRR
jgi:hypothetical protein